MPYRLDSTEYSYQHDIQVLLDVRLARILQCKPTSAYAMGIVSMKGKICVITGATSGIGRKTALALAREGAWIVIVGRDSYKGTKTVESLKAETGNDLIEFEQADLSSHSDIYDLAARLNTRLAHLDVLVNNVGAWFNRRIQSADGIEMTWALNHLCSFLLTGLLLDLISKSGAGRIVNVSSIFHYGPQINFRNPEGSRIYSGWRAYQQSKLANIMFTYRLTELLNGGITANCLHPGMVNSGFGQNTTSGMTRLVIGLTQRFISINETEGAKTSTYLASNETVANMSGAYFVKCRPVRSSRASLDQSAQARLWQISEKMTGHSYSV